MTSRASKTRLPASEREILGVVARAAFANPFGPERDALDRTLSGEQGRNPLKVALLRLDEVLDTWKRSGRADLRTFPAEWREAAELLVLFVFFHRSCAEFDALIRRQQEAGSAVVRAPFVARLITDLTAFGITREAALRYVGFFHQLRRAWHFLSAGLVGESASMRALRERLWGNIFTRDMRWYVRHLWTRMEDYSTLLIGETGTGKGAAAAALGRSGFIPYHESTGAFEQSFTEAFVAINLAESPPALLEAELFGHRKGAFTGALESREGVFARCSRHGAIFLDEIGEIAAPVQVKLLRVLQERTFIPVGDRIARRFEGRIIAATNADLTAARAAGTFREDFYFRLCSDVIEVPPLRVRLRERPAELDELSARLLTRMTGQEDAELLAHVRDALHRDLGADYAWPGNVRELEQAIRRILLTGSCATALASPNEYEPADTLVRQMREGLLNSEALLSAYCSLLYARHKNFSAVARITGLDRRTVRKYIEK